MVKKKAFGELRSVLEGGNLKQTPTVKVPSVAKANAKAAKAAKTRKNETSMFSNNSEQTSIFSQHQIKMLESMIRRVHTTSLTTVGMADLLAISEYNEKQKTKKEPSSLPQQLPSAKEEKEEVIDEKKESSPQTDGINAIVEEPASLVKTESLDVPPLKPRKKRVSKLQKQEMKQALIKQQLDQQCQLHILTMSLFSIGQALKSIIHEC